MDSNGVRGSAGGIRRKGCRRLRGGSAEIANFFLARKPGAALCLAKGEPGGAEFSPADYLIVPCGWGSVARPRVAPAGSVASELVTGLM